MASPKPLERPAFYALRPGGWRDLITLLHPPYTAWHLSYVAIGAAAAPNLYGDRLAAALGAFFLGVGVCAHALDELNGRPLGTRLSDRSLVGLAVVALAGAVAIGIVGAATVSLSLVPFVAAGAFIVVAYNLELFGGRFHSDFWFAAAWGAFPALTGYWVSARGSGGCGVLHAQRRSAPPEHTGARLAAHHLGQRTAAARGRQRGPARCGAACGAARQRAGGVRAGARAARRRARDRTALSQQARRAGATLRGHSPAGAANCPAHARDLDTLAGLAHVEHAHDHEHDGDSHEHPHAHEAGLEDVHEHEHA